VSAKKGTGKNGTGNNGTNGKVGKNGPFSILRFGVGLRAWNGEFRFRDGGLSSRLGFKGQDLRKFNSSAPFLPTFPFVPLLPVPLLPVSF